MRSHYIILLLLFDSMHFIWARLLLFYVDPSVSALYVMGIATLKVGLYGWIMGGLSLQILRKNFIFFSSIGILIGVSTLLTFTAVKYIDAGTAAMLSKMSTLFGIGFGVFWLKEHFASTQLGGALLAIGGALIIAYQPGSIIHWGALILILSTFCYSAHFAIVKRYGGEIDFLNFFFYRVLFSIIALLLISIGRQTMIWPTPMAWLIIGLVGTIDVVASRSFYYLALRKLNMSLLSVIANISPAIAIIWAFILFGTTPTVQQLIGGIAVLTGVFIVTKTAA
ncbi:DMT family transporter [Chloroflexi bacterium TSY]|nr:DMT family transporter [Chloroflexi bacterium TSY]